MIALEPIDSKVYFCKGLCISDSCEYVINWDELTIEDGIKLASIELSDNFVEFYKESDAEKKRLLVLEFTNEELTGIFPNIYREVIGILTTIEKSVINEIDADSLSVFYHTYCSAIHLSCKYLTPDEFNKVDRFNSKGFIYYLPKSNNIFGVDVPMYNETALTFCESLDMTRMNISGISTIIGILCRKRDEKYDQDKAIQRSDEFKSLSMNVCWSVLFLFNECITYIEDHYKWIFGKSKNEAKIINAYNKSGLKDIGSMAFIYEVVEGTNERLEEVKNMPLYEFLPLLSYLRSKDKFIKYASV